MTSSSNNKTCYFFFASTAAVARIHYASLQLDILPRTCSHQVARTQLPEMAVTKV